MNYENKKWKKHSIGGIGEIQYGSSFKSTDGDLGYKTFRMNELVNGFTQDNGLMKRTNIEEKEFKKYKLNKGDLLFNRTNSFEHVGRTAMFNLDGEYMFASYLLRISVDRKVIEPLYLNTVMNSHWFQTNIKRYATKAVGQSNINANSLGAFKVPIPPLSVQTQIVDLFQAIETAIVETEQQGNNLKLLQKALVDGLLRMKPEFGNLLNERNCTLTTFGDIAECDKKYPEHNGNVERFVGLENIEPGDFKLQGFGLVSNGTTFTKPFSKGDVLFGKRRAYLKKVAVADFSGICSNDILVIRAKTRRLLQGLVPFYIYSDKFIQHAISTSAGSLSPRTRWKDLETLKVVIPDLKTQEKILEVFEQLQLALEQIKTQKQTLRNLKQKLLNEILE